MQLRFFLLLLTSLLACSASSAQTNSNRLGVFSRVIIGGEFEYTAKQGDYAARISSRFAAPDRILSVQNKLAPNRVLRSGEKVIVNNLHVVPPAQDEDIVINLPQRMLFYFDEGEFKNAYAVGLGKRDWPTPAGRFRIVNRQENKPWIVPKSIQEEMEREGKAVLTEVPPGPNNPLGKHWLGLSLPGIGIHGTIAPVSVYRYRSHGCIRMHPDDIEELFEKASVDMEGRIIYATVLLAQLADGRIFLEVHNDVYKKGGDPTNTARNLAEDNGLIDRIDWSKARNVIQRKDGIAIEITRKQESITLGKND